MQMKPDHSINSKTIMRTFLRSTVIAILLLACLPLKAGTVWLSGSDWFNGNGCDVFSNQSSDVGDRSYYNGVDVGLKWECVELVGRFYYIKGWRSSKIPYNAGDIYPNAGSMGMTAHANGSGYVPVPGDMVTWDVHVAVVDYVDSSKVHIVEQNVSSTCKKTMTRSGTNGSHVERDDGLFPGQCQGFVHSPNNPYQNTINPPYFFNSDAQGWTSGHSLSAVIWTTSDDWPGIIYADQNGNDGYFVGPDTSYMGMGYPSVNVSVYPQTGTTDSHNMQMFYRTAAENSYAADKSSPVVLYRLQNNWARINLDFNGSYLKYYNQTVTGLRLDVDPVNSSTRWIVNHIVAQSSLRWDFSSDAQGWTSANSLSPVSWSDFGGVGIVSMDQTGADPQLVSASGLQMYGGINDRVHVRVYPQNGSTANHDMQIFFATDQDHSFSEDKSLRVYYTAKDEWADVYFDFGVANKWNGNFNKDDFIRQIRLDLDGVNHGNHWIIDYVRVEHKTDASSIAAPTIGQQPASQTANQGDTVTFSVYPNGHAPFTYQWQKNGVNISGNTGTSLTLANVQTGDAASYACVASNSGGSRTSDNAILTVNVPTSRIISLSGNLAFGNVPVGGSAQATLTIANTGNSTLTVSSINYPSGFIGNWSSGIISANGSQNVTVTFSPTSASSYDGNITVNSDATSGTGTIAVSGTGTGTQAPRQLTGMNVSNGVFRFVLNGPVGSNYVIQVSSNLVNWLSFSTNTIPAGRSLNISDPGMTNQPERFYRAVWVAQTNPDPGRLAWIAAGTFTMGSPDNEQDRYYDEGPQTVVTLTDGFYMGKYEVTQGEYLAVMGSNPSWFTGDTNRPVEMVSWNGATDYCAQLTIRERAAGRISSGWVYRLPTEAEWEYTCRGGTTNRFSFGDDPSYTLIESYAWYGVPGGTTHPVGVKLPNPWGLYDMHGNVYEWCQDWYTNAYPGGSVTNPTGPGSGSYRVMRGGGFGAQARECRSAWHSGNEPAYRNCDIGFRVVLAPGQP